VSSPTPVQVPAERVIDQLKRRIAEDAVQLAILSSQVEVQEARIADLEAAGAVGPETPKPAVAGAPS